MLRLSTSLFLMLCWTWGTQGTTSQLSAQPPGQKPADQPAAVVAWQAQIETALQKSLTAEFMETPLTDVVAFLRSQTGLLILVDAKALDNVGVGTDTPVTCNLANISLRSILQHVLRPLGLRFVLRDGALMITSSEDAEKQLEEEIFDVSDFVCPAGTAELARCDSNALIDAITSTVDPQSWSTVGGPGSLECFRGRLVASQTREVQEKIRRWLASYRKAKLLAEKCVDKAPPVVSAPNEMDDAAIAEIDRALKQPITLQFRETPLEDVVQYLRQATKVNIAIDRHALDNVGVGTDTPISFEAPPLQLRHALRHILRPIGCTYWVRDQVLLLTSSEECEKEPVTQAYPVADLLGRSDGTNLFGNPRRPASMEQLQNLLTTTIAPQTWADVGGPGSVAHCGPIDVLVISQSAQVHEQVGNLLRLLRQNLAQASQAEAAEKKPPGNEGTRLVVYSLPTAAKPPQTTPPAKPNAGAAPPQAQELSNPPPVLAQTLCGGVGGGWAKPPIPEEQLVQLIAELIEPESWKSRKDVYLRAVSGRLLVRHTEAVHHQVQELLSHLGISVQLLSNKGGTGLVGTGGGMM